MVVAAGLFSDSEGDRHFGLLDYDEGCVINAGLAADATSSYIPITILVYPTMAEATDRRCQPLLLSPLHSDESHRSD